MADTLPRVLWLTKGLGPGGAERLLVAVASVRDRAAFTYEAAYLIPKKSHLVGDLEALDVPVECLRSDGGADLRWAARLRHRLHDDPVQIVHSHSPYVAGVARMLVRSLPRALRPRLVSTEHNGWSTFARPTRLLNAWTSPLDDVVLSVSDYVRESMSPGTRARARTIIHGIDLEDTRTRLAGRDAARAELGVDPGTVLVGTVANYTIQKDYPTMLGTARLVTDSGAPVKFVAIGQGQLEAETIALRDELRLGDAVMLTGYHPDPPKVIAGCDLFLLTSRWEALPVAIMEALALGLPLVATDVGGIPEMITDGVEGILVPAERPDLAAEAVLALAADPERRARMGAASLERSAAYDIRRATRSIEAIYRDLLGT